MRLFSHRRRPVHLGPFPLERLPRAAAPVGPLTGAQPTDPRSRDDACIARAMPEYQALFARFLDGPAAPAQAPIPEDPVARADNLKAAAYFLDVAQAAACAIPPDAWLPGDHPPHTHALVFLVEFGREPLAGDPGEDWIRGAQAERGDLRAAEAAVVLSGYLRNMGWSARGHVHGTTLVDLGRLAVQAGLARVADGTLANPYLGRRFRVGAITTDFAIAADAPLAPGSLASRWRSHGPAWWVGAGGTRCGWPRLEGGLRNPSRPLHLGPAPMEKIRRAADPTTLVIGAEIKRQPKRANFFTRALMGDLGEKAKRERMRFATKNPYAFAMTPLIREMVPMQGGDAAPRATGRSDPARSADAIKALGYWLGADLVGICEAPAWMWYSHKDDGTPIEPYHRYAVVMLIDQGFETMEGASGDDWISGAQSMRAYMRGAQIAGVMAAHLRRLGHPARSQTNADSDILQIPPTLMAGLGELSRIGELVLSPFVGPRFKTVVLTTDLPLAADRPIDFGLQDFCAKCTKCARECPCMAIPFGPKVMFNGYEIWKPDVEKCAKYRVTNAKGSACGRCMKTCPFNTEGLLVHRLFLWLAINVPWTRGWIARLDDKVANGAINRTKKWWFDLEMVDGVSVAPKGVNARGLDFEAVKRAKGQALALFPPEASPPPGAKTPVEPDRAAAIRAYAGAESPAAARLRVTPPTSRARR